jgi:hypothetical protein
VRGRPAFASLSPTHAPARFCRFAALRCAPFLVARALLPSPSLLRRGRRSGSPCAVNTAQTPAPRVCFPVRQTPNNVDGHDNNDTGNVPSRRAASGNRGDSFCRSKPACFPVAGKPARLRANEWFPVAVLAVPLKESAAWTGRVRAVCSLFRPVR